MLYKGKADQMAKRGGSQEEDDFFVGGRKSYIARE